MDSNKTHLISYPRSGNHAVRAILEFCSGRPTSGCPESEDIDPPIHTKPANSDGLIQIHSHNTIAYKSHFINQVLYWDRNISKDLKIILITRDPLKSVFSHVYRELRKILFIKSRDVDEAVEMQINNYMALVYLFCASKNRDRFHIKYEDIFSDNSAESLEKINGMLRFVDPDINQISSDELDSLFKVSKKSQQSLRTPKKISLETLILKSINARLIYSEILATIADS